MVYLDYSSTTPILPEILDSHNKVTNQYIGNPHSLHTLGIKSKELLDGAIKQMAHVLKIKTSEIILTSGATEANNIALKETAFTRGKKGSRIIVSKLEHDSIYRICDYLTENGFVIDYVNNDEEGIIDFEHLKNIITPETILVSICGVNSELGIRQPLKFIKQVITKENPKIIFHSDMTQGMGKIPMSFSDVDLASLSSHKVYGPKGIGLLYKKDGIKINQLMYEAKNELRPGTPALPLITSFSKALRIGSEELDQKEEHVTKLNNRICEALKDYSGVLINKTKYSIPHILNISLMDIKPETFIQALSKHKVYVGSNTACSSGKISNAVLNIYHDKKRALTTIRISLSYLTKISEINSFLTAFKKEYSLLSELKNEADNN